MKYDKPVKLAVVLPPDLATWLTETADARQLTIRETISCCVQVQKFLDEAMSANKTILIEDRYGAARIGSLWNVK